MLAVGVAIITGLLIFVIGLTVILQFPLGVYVLLVLDIVVVVSYVQFLVDAINGVRQRRYQHATATAVTYGIIVALVGLLLFFAATYYILATQWDGQFLAADNSPGILTRVDAFYFAATVFTTTGFGDIHAAGQLARTVVAGQMILTYIYAVTALGLIVSASTSH